MPTQTPFQQLQDTRAALAKAYERQDTKTAHTLTLDALDSTIAALKDFDTRLRNLEDINIRVMGALKR